MSRGEMFRSILCAILVISSYTAGYLIANDSYLVAWVVLLPIAILSMAFIVFDDTKKVPFGQ